MNNLFEFVDFGDNNSTSATPSGRPKKKSTTLTPPEVKPEPKAPEPKPKRQQKIEPDIEIKIEPEVKLEESISILPPYDNSHTITYLKSFFDKSEKVGKENLICYADRKTMFGRKITATDKVKELGIVNAQHALSNTFISTTFKLIVEAEISQVAKMYTSLGAVRHYPLVVEIQYMADPKHNKVLMRIQDEFL
jgi:hypothetical protein